MLFLSCGNQDGTQYSSYCVMVGRVKFVNILVRTGEEDWDMRTKGVGNGKKKKCRTGEGNATWGNSDLDLASKPAFAWTQDLHL